MESYSKLENVVFVPRGRDMAGSCQRRRAWVESESSLARCCVNMRGFVVARDTLWENKTGFGIMVRQKKAEFSRDVVG